MNKSFHCFIPEDELGVPVGESVELFGDVSVGESAAVCEDVPVGGSVEVEVEDVPADETAEVVVVSEAERQTYEKTSKQQSYGKWKVLSVIEKQRILLFAVTSFI